MYHLVSKAWHQTSFFRLKKKKGFSCFICKPPDSPSPPSPIQEPLQGRQCFHERTPWRKISALIWEKGRYLFLSTKHAMKSNQARRRKPFWRPWPWLNWPSLWRCYGWLDDSSDKEKMVQCVPGLVEPCIPSSNSSCLEQGVQISPDVKLINSF